VASYIKAKSCQKYAAEAQHIETGNGIVEASIAEEEEHSSAGTNEAVD
jgi:hypothetical protein